MTDQKYKLVPVEPTGKMTKAAMGALPPSLHRLDMVSINAAVRHAIASAPEPVCRWKNDGLGAFCGTDFITECGNELHNICDAFPLCPHCGKKIEVVGYE